MAVWQFIHGFASRSEPEKVTFYDHHDETLYRNLAIDVIGQHGWELVSVLLAPDPKTNELRYEYFFKRQRGDENDDGVARPKRN